VLTRLSFGPLRAWTGSAAFARDYRLGHYDAIIVRGEHELRVRGPRYHLHAELGLAYNAILEYERALEHLQTDLAWLHAHPLPRFFSPASVLATTYSNLAGVLEALGRREEAQTAVEQGLDLDGRHPMLQLIRSRQLAERGDGSGAVRHLTAAFEMPRMPRGFDKSLLLFAQDLSFSGVRDEPQFQWILPRAAAS